MKIQKASTIRKIAYLLFPIGGFVLLYQALVFTSMKKLNSWLLLAGFLLILISFFLRVFVAKQVDKSLRSKEDKWI